MKKKFHSRKKNKLYSIISLISVLLRQFVLPNPYINIIREEVCADLFNIFVGGAILHYLAYILTGCGYIKGVNNPASGSAGYFISYCYLTALITFLGYFINSIEWFVALFILIYSILLCG